MPKIVLKTISRKECTIESPFTPAQLLQTVVEAFSFDPESIKISYDGKIQKLMDLQGDIESLSLSLSFSTHTPKVQKAMDLRRLDLKSSIDDSVLADTPANSTAAYDEEGSWMLVFGTRSSGRAEPKKQLADSFLVAQRKFLPLNRAVGMWTDKGNKVSQLEEMRLTKDELREGLETLDALAKEILQCDTVIESFLRGEITSSNKTFNLNKAVLTKDTDWRCFFSSLVLQYIAAQHSECLQRGNKILSAADARISPEDSLYEGCENRSDPYYYLKCVLSYIYKRYPNMFALIEKNSSEFVLFLNNKSHREFYFKKQQEIASKPKDVVEVEANAEGSQDPVLTIAGPNYFVAIIEFDDNTTVTKIIRSQSESSPRRGINKPSITVSGSTDEASDPCAGSAGNVQEGDVMEEIAIAAAASPEGSMSSDDEHVNTDAVAEKLEALLNLRENMREVYEDLCEGCSPQIVAPPNNFYLSLYTKMQQFYQYLMGKGFINKMHNFIISDLVPDVLLVAGSGNASASADGMVGTLTSAHSQIQTLIKIVMEEMEKRFAEYRVDENLIWLLNSSAQLFSLCEMFYFYLYNYVMLHQGNDLGLTQQLFGCDRTLSLSALACKCALARLLVVEVSELFYGCIFLTEMQSNIDKHKAGCAGKFDSIHNQETVPNTLRRESSSRVGALRSLISGISLVRLPVSRYITAEGPTMLLKALLDRVVLNTNPETNPILLYVNTLSKNGGNMLVTCNYMCYVLLRSGVVVPNLLYESNHMSNSSAQEEVSNRFQTMNGLANALEEKDDLPAWNKVTKQWKNLMRIQHEIFVKPIMKYLPAPKTNKEPLYVIDAVHMTFLRILENAPISAQKMFEFYIDVCTDEKDPSEPYEYTPMLNFPKVIGNVRFVPGFANDKEETMIERWCIAGSEKPWEFIFAGENRYCMSPRESKSILISPGANWEVEFSDSESDNGHPLHFLDPPSWLNEDVQKNLQFHYYPFDGTNFKSKEHFVVLHEMDQHANLYDEFGRESPPPLHMFNYAPPQASVRSDLSQRSSSSRLASEPAKSFTITMNGLAPPFVGDLHIIEDSDISRLYPYKSTIYHVADFNAKVDCSWAPNSGKQLYVNNFYSLLMKNPQWTIAYLHQQAVLSVLAYHKEKQSPAPWLAIEYMLYDNGARLASLDGLMYFESARVLPSSVPRPLQHTVTSVPFRSPLKANPHILVPLKMNGSTSTTRKNSALPSITLADAKSHSVVLSKSANDTKADAKDYFQDKQIFNIFQNMLDHSEEAKTKSELAKMFVSYLENNSASTVAAPPSSHSHPSVLLSPLIENSRSSNGSAKRNDRKLTHRSTALSPKTTDTMGGGVIANSASVGSPHDSSSTGGNSTQKCAYCHLPGHTARYCPNAKKES